MPSRNLVDPRPQNALGRRRGIRSEKADPQRLQQKDLQLEMTTGAEPHDAAPWRKATGTRPHLGRVREEEARPKEGRRSGGAINPILRREL
jgi:hypothetical protein